MDQMKLINMYLYQDRLYHSDSQGDMILIKDMVPEHAANAARLMLMDADKWSKDASRLTSVAPSLWMMNTPLWRALHERATIRGASSSLS